VTFLLVEEALELHRDQIERFGGTHGMRDEGAFLSALAAAENRAYYEGADIIACAATYAFHLCQAHAFIDGNKRIGAAAMLVFLETNGKSLESDDEENIAVFLQIASGAMTRDALETFLRAHVRQTP